MLKRLVAANKFAPDNNDNSHDEHQYLNLIRDILKEGKLETGRNGATKAIFGAAMHFSLENNTIPLLTSKKVAWKTCLRELLWFITGKTDNAVLQKQKVHIWDANASREYLDSRGLHNLEENDLGPVYGHQWRHFNAKYETCHTNYFGKGVDQLQNIINTLKNPETRTSRRIILSAWNPNQLDEMALPPCHILAQFNVFDGNKLSCSLYQRSGDVGLGVPFNIASYSFLTHLIARHCGLIASEFIYYLGNAHIYDDHLIPLEEQTYRSSLLYEFPKVFINLRNSIEDYTLEDFTINNYDYHPTIKMIMRT